MARDGHWRNAFELLGHGRSRRISTPEATRSSAMNACKEVHVLHDLKLTSWIKLDQLGFGFDFGLLVGFWFCFGLFQIILVSFGLVVELSWQARGEATLINTLRKHFFKRNREQLLMGSCLLLMLILDESPTATNQHRGSLSSSLLSAEIGRLRCQDSCFNVVSSEVLSMGMRIATLMSMWVAGLAVTPMEARHGPIGCHRTNFQLDDFVMLRT